MTMDTLEPSDDYKAEVYAVLDALGADPAHAEGGTDLTIGTLSPTDQQLHVARAKLRINIERTDTLDAVARRLRRD